MKLTAFMRNIYGKKFCLHTTSLFALALISSCAKFIITYYLGQTIDAVTKGYDETIRSFSIIALSLLFFILTSALFTFCSGKMTAGFTHRLRVQIGSKICRARYLDIEQIKDGDLLTMASKDIESLKNWLTALLKSGEIPVQLILAPVCVFRFSRIFFLFTIFLIPLAAVPEILMARRLHTYHAAEKKAYADMTSFFTTTIELIMIIKSFLLESFCEKQNDEMLDAYKKARMKRILHEQLVDVYGRCFGHITNPLMLLLGALFILSGKMSIGMLASIILFADYVGDGLKLINAIPLRFQEAKAGMQHIHTLLLLPKEAAEDELPSKSPLPSVDCGLVYDVKSLCFQYENKRILQDVTFPVKKGEKIAIVGFSGCGKTTLFKLLSGLYPPPEGSVFFRGKDIATYSPSVLRKQITATTQETFLFHASFAENIKIAKPHSSQNAIIQAGEYAQIDTFIRSFDTDYNTVVSTTVQSVSNGQMQRINLARAFLKDTDVFLLDEPTSALDSNTTEKIFDFIFRTYGDKTVLMILHNLREIHRFDKILVLSGGRVVGFGNHDSLLKECEAYRRLNREQTFQIQTQ